MRYWIASLLCLIVLARGAMALPLEAYQHDRMLAKEAHAIAMHAAHDYLFRGLKPTGNRLVNDRRFKAPGAVFVTITRDGKTRGCWGSVQPERSTLADEIAMAAVKALRYDYRHRPIAKSEWPTLRFYVSLVGPMTPVSSVAALAPLRQGLYVTSHGRGGVLLPGEAKTARYQLAECRKKAGLRPREPLMMYRFNTVVFGPESENL